MTTRKPRRTVAVDGVWDMECAGWTHPVVIVTLHRRGGLGVHRTVGEAVQRMESFGGHWWAHNGGHYDTLAALEWMRTHGKSRLINESQGRVTRSVGGGLTLSDSYALVPLGLDAASELGGVRPVALGWPCHCGWDCGGYCAIPHNPSSTQLAEITAYCASDCEANLAMLDGLIAWASEHDIDIKGTVGSSAWATLQRQLLIPDASHSPSMERRIREAYYGGRTGVYRVSAPHLRQWDMTGAYPTALTQPVPVGPATELGGRAATDALARQLPGLYACVVEVPESHLPTLPWRYHGRTYYPHGRVAGVWVLPELEYALSLGARVLRVTWAVTWPRTESILATTMQQWAGWRAQAGKDSALGKWLRLLANSLIGKLGERGDRSVIRLHPDRDDVVRHRCVGRAPCTVAKCTGRCGHWRQLDQWGELWSAPYYRQAPSAHVQWAAYATARTRIEWHREASRHGLSLAYGATDSVWTSDDVAPASGIGAGLGQWELKDTWTDWEGRAHGQYRGTSATESRLVLRTAGARISPAQWQAGEAPQDRGVASLSIAARTGKGLFVRRAEKWTLPQSGEWCSDRLTTPDGPTVAPTCEQVRRKNDGVK